MVDDSLEVADEVGEFATKGSVDGYADCFLGDAGDEDICKGNTLADKESGRREVGLESVEGTGLVLNKATVCV